MNQFSRAEFSYSHVSFFSSVKITTEWKDIYIVNNKIEVCVYKPSYLINKLRRECSGRNHRRWPVSCSQNSSPLRWL